MAVIAVPCLQRDELAMRLHVQASTATEVQTALHQEDERAVQVAEQPENQDRQKRIELLVASIARETSATRAEEPKADQASVSAQREAEELVAGAETFNRLLAGMPITPQPVAPAALAERKPLDQWLGIDAITSGGLTKAQLRARAETLAKRTRDVPDSDDPAGGDVPK